MLSWLLNRPTDGGNGADEDPAQEPPETPAPVFAARALKSAFFGTPAPPVEDTTLENKTETEPLNHKDTRNPQYYNMSPTKPTGILLTPGTATTRRKTVSFGSEVADKNKQNVEGQAGVKSRRQSLSKQKEQPSNNGYRKTPLTKSLEMARDTNPGKNKFERNQGSSRSQPLIDLAQEASGTEEVAATRTSGIKPSTLQTSNQDLLQELISGEEIDGDMTMDLNEPHSQSGKYWKTEYEQYHGEAKVEMEKLLRYKQLAKSYAKHKDAEKLALAEKLKEEQRRVTSLEDKMSRLSAQTATNVYTGNSDGPSELIKELAKQSALAREYKTQVEEFRAKEKAGQAIASGKNGISSLSEETLPDARRVATLREEMRDLRQALSTAQKNSSRLQEENARLTQELLYSSLRLEEQEDKSERRRRATEEQLQKKTEALKILQQDYNTLKEKAKAQRGNAEQALRKKHEQAVELRKELASLKRAESTAKANQQHQKKSLDDEGIVSYQPKQKPNLGEKVGDLQEKRPSPMESKKFDLEIRSRQSNNNSNTRNIDIPILGQSIPDASKSPKYWRQANVEPVERSPTVQEPHNALSEIVNNAGTERSSYKRSKPMERTPPSRRISNISRETPNIELPSPEPFVPHITDYKFKPSPRPSMFTFTSSPPKPDMQRPDALDKLTEQKSDGNIGGERDVPVASTRLPSLSGSRTRSPMPPGRAAAAQDRIAKRMAEKRRARALGTENENTRQ